MGDINKFMESLPRDFLFVLRSTNIVRSLNKDLGGSSRDRFIAMAQSAIKGVEIEDQNLRTLKNINNQLIFNIFGPYNFFENISSYVKKFWWWLFRLFLVYGN